MPDITINNTDWTILAAVRDAVASAAAGGGAVFAAVSVTTSPRQALQCQLVSSPAVVLRYVTTREEHSPEEVRGCVVAMELLIAAAVDAAGPDESARLQEVLRLKNAAVNAVETSPPAGGSAWGDGGHYHARLAWGQAEIDASPDRPWAVCRLPLEAGYTLAAPTGH
jgi:hypothetical protein